MNRISKAGTEQKGESGNQESRNRNSRIPFLLVSRLPDFLLIFSCLPIFLIHSASAAPVIIGSKKFTESYVIGEIAKRALTDAGLPVEHRQGMGGTIILWQALRQRYTLTQQNVIGIDHGLGYSELANGSINIKDAYSTDAKIEQNNLVVLEDDLQFFPKYEAVFLFRLSMPTDAIAVLRRLQGTLDEQRMIRLNAEAERTKNYTRAADSYFEHHAGSASAVGESFSHKLARWTLRHLQLAGFSLLLSVIFGIPLVIVASRGGPVGQGILGFASIVQTIPSLALLALLVPLPFFGISVRTAIAALFLYGLLPIVRNTASGLQDIPRSLRESAIALGLS